MGSFIGHAVPGTIFLLAGFWWLVNVVIEYATSLRQPHSSSQQNKSHRSWKKTPAGCCRNVPVEPLVKIMATFMGICGELTPEHWSIVDANNDFQATHNFAHASMYSFFAFSGLVELLNFYKVTNFSRELEFVVLAAAFSIEGILFSFHLHGRDMFDVRIHTLLYIITFLTALVICLEACLPRYQRELFMARTVLSLTQGTWFWEIAFTLYGPHRWFREASVDLTEDQLMKDTAVITVAVCWHILAWCGVLLIVCVITSCLHKRGRLCSCCLNSQIADKDATTVNGNGRFGFGGKKVDEEIALLSEDLKGNNNAIRKEIAIENDNEDA